MGREGWIRKATCPPVTNAEKCNEEVYRRSVTPKKCNARLILTAVTRITVGVTRRNSLGTKKSYTDRSMWQKFAARCRRRAFSVSSQHPVAVARVAEALP